MTTSTNCQMRPAVRQMSSAFTRGTFSSPPKLSLIAGATSQASAAMGRAAAAQTARIFRTDLRNLDGVRRIAIDGGFFGSRRIHGVGQILLQLAELFKGRAGLIFVRGQLGGASYTPGRHTRRPAHRQGGSPNWRAGDTITVGHRSLRVVAVRDDDADQPPALVVEDMAE